MKYHAGQKVILLDTEYKPAGSATVCDYIEISGRYLVDFTYSGSQQPEKISVPEERLLEVA